MWGLSRCWTRSDVAGVAGVAGVAEWGESRFQSWSWVACGSVQRGEEHQGKRDPAEVGDDSECDW